MDIVPNMVRDIILLNLSAKITIVAKLGFVRIINNRIWSLEHSHKSHPNIISDKYIQIHSDDFNIDFLLLYKFKLVLKVTYLTWLHTCRQDNQSNMTEPKHRIKIWRIL